MGSDPHSFTSLTVSDQDLAVKAEWHDDIQDNYQLDINKSLYYYLKDASLQNNLGQKISYFEELDPSQHYQHIGPVKGEVVIKTSDNEFRKEVENFRFNQISIKDVVGDASVAGEVTLEFRVDESPIPITPFSEVINVVNE